jgi:hypothetical protein
VYRRGHRPVAGSTPRPACTALVSILNKYPLARARHKISGKPPCDPQSSPSCRPFASLLHVPSAAPQPPDAAGAAMVSSVSARLGPVQDPLFANMLDPISRLMRRVLNA